MTPGMYVYHGVVDEEEVFRFYFYVYRTKIEQMMVHYIRCHSSCGLAPVPSRPVTPPCCPNRLLLLSLYAPPPSAGQLSNDCCRSVLQAKQ